LTGWQDGQRAWVPPQRVLLGGDWLAISRLGRRQRVRTGSLDFTPPR
jgi:hypothetical protein